MKAECSKMMVQFWKALLLLFFSVTFFSFSVPFSCFSVFLLSLFLSLSPVFSGFSPFFFCSPLCFLFFVFCPLFSPPVLRSLLLFSFALLTVFFSLFSVPCSLLSCVLSSLFWLFFWVFIGDSLLPRPTSPFLTSTAWEELVSCKDSGAKSPATAGLLVADFDPDSSGVSGGGA